MQPMKPEEVDRILRERPHVSREHIHEYQKLVAQHFDVNPRLAKTIEQRAFHEAGEQRLHELHNMIFG